MISKPPPLPGSLNVNRKLAIWLHFNEDRSVTISPGKVEIGQGIHTALVQIAAEELDVHPHRVRVRPPSTASSAQEGVTSGSLSVQDSGSALRQVCAEARALFLAAAGQRLGVDPGTLTVQDGAFVAHGNLQTSYWELADTGLLEREATGGVSPKPVHLRTRVGRRFDRIDVPDKVFGRPRFLHDLSWPGLVHGCVIRPPAAFATLAGLGECPDTPERLAVVRDGSFLGVVAETEDGARREAAAMAAVATWQQGDTLPNASELPTWLRAQPVETHLISERLSPHLAVVERTLTRTYSRPYIAHASIAPSCAVALWLADGLEVWTHSQGIFNLRTDLARLLGLSPDRVVVNHVEGAGCYGHNGADDVACDAALLARAVPGRPVRVQWSRADELAWSPVGAAADVEISADLDAAGNIVTWRHDVWSNGHVSRPGRAATPTLLAGYHLEKPAPRLPSPDPPISNGGGSERNAVPDYEFPSWRIRNHRLQTMPLRVSSLRTLGAYANVFARESFIDEVAVENGQDGLEFRLRHLPDARSRAVLEAAADRAEWASWRVREGWGHGIAFARYKNNGAYCAVVAIVEVAADVRVHRLVCAIDAGEVVNPDGLINQIEGGAIQSTSWTLKEAVRFDATRITSDSWESYPILRFSEAPDVDVVVLDRPDAPFLGAGEAAHGPVAAAIANAVAHAIGVRVRRLPLNREAIISALDETQKGT